MSSTEATEENRGRRGTQRKVVGKREGKEGLVGFFRLGKNRTCPLFRRVIDKVASAGGVVFGRLKRIQTQRTLRKTEDTENFYL